MVKFFKLGLGIFVGVLLGAVSVVVYLQASLADNSRIQNGPWETDLTTGSAEADMYTRARVALGGLLALSKEETIYYTAFRDGEGLTLSENCDYILRGFDPATRWWSITAYAADNYLPKNTDNRLSVAKSTVVRAPDGRFTVRVSAIPKHENWLSSRNAGNFSLTLRLYNPRPAVYEAPHSTPLPTIEREACR